MKSSARSIRSRRGNRDGFVLPAGLFALIIVSVLMVAAVQMGDNERRATRALRESGVALYAAESGLRATLGAWPAAVAALNPGDSLDLGRTTLINRASYWAVIHRVDNGGSNKMYAIMVQARGAGPLGGRSGVMGIVSTTPGPGAGFVTLGDFTLHTGNTADSYNSTGCANPLIDGCYSSTHDSSLTIKGGGAVDVHGAYVYGSIQSGSTIDAAGAVLTGGSTASMTPSPVIPANYPTPTCPASYSPASDLPPSKGSGTYTSYIGGILKVQSGAQLTLSDTPTGGAYFFEQIIISGSGSLMNVGYGTPANPVTIYYHDKFSVGSGDYVNNLSKSPRNLKISSCLKAGDSPSYSGHGLTISGGASSYFQIYAPNQDVVVGGTGGGLWGSIVGLTIDASGSGNLHYDKALGGGTAWTLISGGWAEMQPF